MKTFYRREEISEVLDLRGYYMSNNNKFKNFNPGNTIVDNTPKLIEFKKKLKTQYEVIENCTSYPEDLEDMKSIINEIELLKIYFEKKMNDKDSGRYRKVISDLDYFYQKFRECFKDSNEIISYINEETEDFFFLRKTYQLSHCYGVFNDNINGNEDIPEDVINYYFLYLFLDSFESFAKFLQPIFKRIWNKSGHITSKYYDNKDIYDDLYNHLFEEREIYLGIDYYDIFNFYRHLRNEIAHSTILISGNKFEIRKITNRGYQINLKRKKQYEECDTKSIFHDIEIFLMVMIIYATEFDIMMLRICLDRDNKSFSSWKKYLHVYWNSWKNIGEEV